MAIIPDECKFHVVSDNVSTVDRGSKLSQSKRESITMADIKQSIPTPEGIFERGSGECSIVPVAGNNTVDTRYGTISGGCCNVISQTGNYQLGSDVIGGGYRNYICSSYCTASNTISGGYTNCIINLNQADGYLMYNTISGGCNNRICTDNGYSCDNTISGGEDNEIRGNSVCNSILGNVNEMQSRNGVDGAGNTYYGILEKNVHVGNFNTFQSGRCEGGTAFGNVAVGSELAIYSCGNRADASYNSLAGYANYIKLLGGDNILDRECSAGVCQSGILGGYCNAIVSCSSSTDSSYIYRSSIAGGYNNYLTVEAGGAICNSSIGGGYCNYIETSFGSYIGNSTIAAGQYNSLLLGDYSNSCILNSTISGGNYNCIYNSATDQYFKGVTISGGGYNGVYDLECGNYNTIAGGYCNVITGSGDISCSTIAGGYSNEINGGYTASAVISGGNSNSIDGDLSYHTFIGGGYGNSISGNYAPRNVIVGGAENSIDNGNTSMIGGGRYNAINGAYHSGIMSGKCNVINGGAASVQTILGGYNNTNGSYESHVIGSNITTDRTCTAFVNNLSIKDIPTAATGLPAGAVWNNAGVLNIV